jgi:hypothetical protein
VGARSVIVFAYEVEVNPAEISSGTITSEVLPPLEQTMVEYLLPTLFPDECAEPPAATGRLGSRGRRRLEVVGVSSLPVDQVLEEMECQQLDVDTNECSYVGGAVTIRYVLREDETLQGFIQTVLDRLKFGMNTDAFLIAHPSIERVTFVEDGMNRTESPTLSPTRVDENRSPGDDDDEIDWWIWLLIGAVMFTVCSGLLAYRYMQSQEEMTHGNPLVGGGNTEGGFPEE